MCPLVTTSLLISFDPDQNVGPDLDPLVDFMDFLRKKDNKSADEMNACKIIQYTKS